MKKDFKPGDWVVISTKANVYIIETRKEYSLVGETTNYHLLYNDGSHGWMRSCLGPLKFGQKGFSPMAALNIGLHHRWLDNLTYIEILAKVKENARKI